MSLLNGWQNFYVIVGSSAAALTGLMFVVTALIVDFGGTEQQLRAFGTPTVVHFGAALLQSLLLSAPWPNLTAMRVALSLFSFAGLVYTAVVMRRARRQADYKPVFEDWLFHAVLPLACYGSVAVAVWQLQRSPAALMFVFAAAATLLLFIGLHNAWDTVTYVLVRRWEASNEHKSRSH